MGFYPNQDPVTSFFNAIGNPGSWLIGFGILILVFVLIREILCWYWKINEIVDLLKNIRENNANTNALLRSLAKQEEGSSLALTATKNVQASGLQDQPKS